MAWIRSKVVNDAVLHADEAPSWNDLHAKYGMKRIDRQTAYSRDCACVTS